MNKVNVTRPVGPVLGVLLIANSHFVSAEESNVANSFSEMFEKSLLSGQIRSGYLTVNPEVSGENTLDDFAIGGQFKLETASLSGISLGAAFYTSHSITRPDGDDFNDEMTSLVKHYDLLAEGYINYAVEGLNVRLGRQLIDTPLADSDDIRMTPHTFEALVGNYDLAEGFTFTAGWLTRWQGVDAGYPRDAEFGDMVSKSDGTFMHGRPYDDDRFEANAWYYSVVDVVHAFYGDIVVPISLSNAMSMTVGAQVSLQSDDTNAETLAEVGSEVGGEFYGIMLEVEAGYFSLGAAWNHAEIDEGETLFGGWGGGPFFTNIDTSVANEFAAGQDADSYTLALGFDLVGMGVDGLSLGYTFGHYEGGSDPFDSSADAEVEEHNFSLEYVISDSWSVDAVYVLSDDKENSADTEWDYDRFQTRVTFAF